MTGLFEAALQLGTGAIQSLGGGTVGWWVSGSSGPCNCGRPARVLKSSSATQRSWTLPAASAQPVATPLWLITSIIRTP